MPAGAAVVRYDGKRGVVWRIKFRDSDGRQVKETLGRADEGWTKRKAEAALRARIVLVEREGYRRIEPTTFAAFAREWIEVYPEAKRLKRSTTAGYGRLIEGQLIPAFGAQRLDRIDVEMVEAFVAKALKAGRAPRTVNGLLNLLNLILTAALRRGMVRSNPVGLVQRPRAPRRRWRILSPAEIQLVERAYDDLIAEAEGGAERAWLQTCRTVFLVLVGTGMRRGEILGLRWRSVRLADPDGATLRVIETNVRGWTDTPKSAAGERTIALGSRLASELFDHRSRTAFDGEDERVFAKPSSGSLLDMKKYRVTFSTALARAGITDDVRPFHDLRHTSITNAAAAGTPPAALMARAGHSDFATTQLYIDLAGEVFREEAERLERRLWGTAGSESGTKKRYQVEVPALTAEEETPD